MSLSLTRALRRAAAATLLAGLAMVPAAGAAAAHDRLVDSSPRTDERLRAAPAEVRLEFSSEVMDVGAAVVVADAAGTDRATGEPVLDGPVVTVPVDPALPDGSYTVRWRVVSSDGHAISGSIPFQVGEAPSSTAPPTPTAATTAGAVPPADAATTGTVTTAPDAGSALRTVLVALAGAAVAVGLYALALVLRRRSATGSH